MFYAFSKAAWFLVQPSSLFGLVALLGGLLAALTRHKRLGGRLATTGILLLLIAGLSPLANLLILPLEQRFLVPSVATGSTAYAGIIVLGGGEDGRVGHARGQLHINEAGERILEAAVLAHRLPSARLIFSGGSARVFLEDAPGAPAIGQFWRAMGIPANRIVLEDRSLTTHENAVLTRDMVKPRAGERWLLVTSAHHMPRSVGTFRKAGFDVVPYPVDFRTIGKSDLLRPFNSIPSGLKRLDDTVKEWVGLIAYCMLGRSDSCYPGP